MAPPTPKLATAGPPVAPFPRQSKISLKRNDKLNNAVAKAVSDNTLSRYGAGAKPAEFAITIVDPATDGMGSFNGGSEFYTGSLVKVGVLDAAFALFEMVKRFADMRAPSVGELFSKLRADMNDAIERSASLI